MVRIDISTKDFFSVAILTKKKGIREMGKILRLWIIHLLRGRHPKTPDVKKLHLGSQVLNHIVPM